ncbi:MAG: cytochrome c biogenesis protein ResB [Desulfurivibrionaceae bacterium]
MKNTKSAVWRLFASVKLALFTLLILATTSIIGTLIPQGKPPEFYIEAFGPRTAMFFQMLNVPNMYSSWWFIALLLLFSNNLIVCTIDRLPNVWQMVVMNNLDTDPERLGKMPHRQVLRAEGNPAALAEIAGGIMAKNGWKAQAEEKSAGSLLLFSQKLAWSRLGVYAVHLSILIIFAGAIIGLASGFKAFVMIPEGQVTDTVYESGSSKPIPLGFTVRCDEFNVSFYDNGSPREYRSVLTVKDITSGKTFTRPIVVNDPLDFKGITFYQSSYEPMQGFHISITNKADNSRQDFRIPFGEKIPWPGTGIEFGIINQQTRSRMGDVAKIKIWFSDGQGEPSIFWLDNNAAETITSPTGTYELKARQVYATGLQVAKDPGVWTVYAGCALMLIGLYVAFFLSHRRVWVYISKEENADHCRILLCGASNKNKIAFEKEFTALVECLTHDSTFQNA